ncbi:MAG TPA: hypothetical protein VI485_16200 [Vicinamibacterales bacterium]|nr:hypothetical protein [Vicinamibacterales bacterium]
MPARLSPVGIIASTMFCVALAGIGRTTHGQSATGVSNVEFSVVDKDGTIVVRYDLLGTGDPSDLFRISVLVSTDGGSSYSVTPRLVSGDVGPGVRSGAGKRIVWNVRDDVKRLQGDAVVFRITADLESSPSFVDPPELRESPTVFELRHRHSGSGVLASDSMHTVRFELTSRTLAFDPLVNAQKPSAGQLPLRCLFNRFVMPIEVVSAKMVTLEPGRFAPAVRSGPGGELGKFLEVVIAEPGDDTKTSTLHLGAGNRSSSGDQLQAFIARVAAARQRRALRSGGSPDITADGLVERAAVALGGTAQLQAIHDFTFTFTLRVFNKTPGGQGIGSAEGAVAGRFRQEQTVNGQTVLIASDGKDVWRQEGGKEPKRVDDIQAKYLKLVDAYFDGLRLSEFARASTIKGQVNVGARVAWRIERTVADGSRVWADLDAETALPLRFGLSSKGLPLLESELFDYAQYGGVREARRRVQYVNGAPAAEVLIRSVQFNTGIQPQRFKLSR